MQPPRELARDLEGVEFKPAREPAHHRDDPEVRILRGRHVADGFAQGRAPADADGTRLLLFQEFRQIGPRRHSDQARHQFGVFRARDHHRIVEPALLAQLMLELGTASERRIEPDADDTAMSRLREHAVDARTRQSEPLADFGLGQVLHVIEPGDPQDGLVTQSAISSSNRKSSSWM